MPLPPTTTPPLYSQRIIRLFSLAFSAVAGGVLTARNLRTVDRPEEARKALFGSVGYTVLMAVLLYFVLRYLPDSSAYGAYVAGIGLAGGYGLNSYADSFIPDKQAYPARSVWRPLLVCLLLVVPIIGLLIFLVPVPA